MTDAPKGLSTPEADLREMADDFSRKNMPAIAVFMRRGADRIKELETKCICASEQKLIDAIDAEINEWGGWAQYNGREIAKRVLKRLRPKT